MKKIELILIAGAAAGFLLSLLNVPFMHLIESILIVILATLYLYLGFALFNKIPFRQILKSESYKGLGKWRIPVAIGTGLGLSQLTIGLMFAMNNYPMARPILNSGLVVTALMLLLALIRNTREKHRFYRIIALRCAIFIIIGIITILVYAQQGLTA